MTRWTLAAGVFVVSLDSTVNVAFPSMAAAFRLPPEQMRWVIICYVLTYALTSFVGGALADRLGHGRVFAAGMGLSAVGFVVAGTAPTFAWLLGGRIVQGVAGGLAYGTAPALATLAAPAEHRARALGFLNTAMGLAFAAGPLLAGGLVDAFGWRVVFVIRIPLALAVLGWIALAAPPAHGSPARAVVSVHRVRGPEVARAGLLAFLANAGIFAIWLLAPFYLIGTRALGTTLAGLLFMLTPLGTTLAAPLAGRLADRIGERIPVVTGLLLEAAGLVLLSRADARTSLAVVALGLLTAGFGLGLFQVPNMASVMAAFPPGRQGAAGGLAFLARTLGVVAGVLTLAEVFARRRQGTGLEAAFVEAFRVAAGAVGMATALALLPARPRRLDPARSRD